MCSGQGLVTDWAHTVWVLIIYLVRGGSRAIPACSPHQVYYQSPDTLGPVCDHLLTRAQGHSAVVLPLITSYFGHLGAEVHGGTTSYRFGTEYIYYITLIQQTGIFYLGKGANNCVIKCSNALSYILARLTFNLS